MSQYLIPIEYLPNNCVTCPLAVPVAGWVTRRCWITERDVSEYYYERCSDCPIIEREK